MEQVYNLSSYRRTYQRIALEASATLVINKSKEEPSGLRDLCPRGAGIVTCYPLKENEKIDIIIQVPYLFASAVYKQAKVAWTKKIDENLWQGGLDFGEANKLFFG